MYQLIGRGGCKETRKAERFFRERKISFQFVDLDKRDLSPGELENIFKSLDPEDIIDKKSRQFEKRGLAYMEYDPSEELLEDQKLIKTPLLRYMGKTLAGFDEKTYSGLLKAAGGTK